MDNVNVVAIVLRKQFYYCRCWLFLLLLIMLLRKRFATEAAAKFKKRKKSCKSYWDKNFCYCNEFSYFSPHITFPLVIVIFVRGLIFVRLFTLSISNILLFKTIPSGVFIQLFTSISTTIYEYITQHFRSRIFRLW